MGLGTASAWVQSKGRLVRDQMTGWTFCVMFSEMATIEHVSCLTATRLEQEVGQPEPLALVLPSEGATTVTPLSGLPQAEVAHST